MKVKSNYAFGIKETMELLSTSKIMDLLSEDAKQIVQDRVQSDYELIKECVTKNDGTPIELDLSCSKNSILNNPLLTVYDREIIQESIFSRIPKEEDFKNEFTVLAIEESMDESKQIKDKIPVFFIFNGGKSLFSRMIMFFTNGDFSHASISTDGLNEIVSFATTEQNNGLVVENYYDFLRIRNPKVIGIHAVLVSFEDYKIIKESIEYYKSDVNGHKYSWKKFFMVPFQLFDKTERQDDPDLICSEFVMHMIKNTDTIKELDADSEIILTPTDVRNKIKVISQEIYEGPPENFDESLVKNFYNYVHKTAIDKKKQIDKEAVKKYHDKRVRGYDKIKKLMPKELRIQK